MVASEIVRLGHAGICWMLLGNLLGIKQKAIQQSLKLERVEAATVPTESWKLPT
jgi:hypothetical protein